MRSLLGSAIIVVGNPGSAIVSIATTHSNPTAPFFSPQGIFGTYLAKATAGPEFLVGRHCTRNVEPDIIQHDVMKTVCNLRKAEKINCGSSGNIILTEDR